MKGLQIGGEGRVAEIDGAYFGGHVRPENRTADRVDRRRAENRSGKRRVVVTCNIRGRDISSFVAEAHQHPPEIPALPCVSVTQTAAEKLVALTRRTAMDLAGLSRGGTPAASASAPRSQRA